MEKVEVKGLSNIDARSRILLAHDAQLEEGFTVAPKAAASAVLAEDDSAINSISSWDTLSLRGLSGGGASLVSLGSLGS